MDHKNILITGGAGFIGSNFVRYLFKKYENIQVLNYDKLTYAGNLQNLKDVSAHMGYSFVKGDICDVEALHSAFICFDPDVVINFAAETHVDRSILKPDRFIQTNVLGVQNLLNQSLETDIERYIQISTDEVYGSLGETGHFTELTPLDPHSPYSASKASADLLTRAYFDTYGLPIGITRCSNNYGPNQFPEKLIPLVILNYICCKKIPVYGDGLNVRDWLHVEDHCRAIDAVACKGRAGQIYNIGGNNERSNIEIIKLIIKLLSEALNEPYSENLITYVADRKAHDRRYAIDSTKIRSELDWKPVFSFENGIKRTITWYLDHQDWLKSAINNEYLDYYNINYVSNS
jgi:dTDP-glucose 4,6-dehydratase